MKEFRTETDFLDNQRSGVVIAITDKMTGSRVHLLPCTYVKFDYFRAKVIVGGNKNGKYFLCDAIEDAESELGARRCACVGRTSPRRPTPREPVSEARDYKVTIVSGATRRIEAYSSDRLNLEPTRDDPRYKMRQEILQGLRGMPPAPGMMLFAAYESAVEGHFDTENILFCNVDPTAGTFARLTQDGLRYERSFTDPRGPGSHFRTG